MKRVFAAILLAILGSSCASIMTGGTDDILVTSMPDGARFRTNTGQVGRTPMSISVPDDKPLSVSFYLDGYEKQSESVGTRMSAWVLGNLVFGGLIGLVVDVCANGSVHKSDHVHADLVALPPVKPEPPPDNARSLPPKKTFEEWSSQRAQPSDLPPH